jgi:hypothetical protein
VTSDFDQLMDAADEEIEQTLGSAAVFVLENQRYDRQVLLGVTAESAALRAARVQEIATNSVVIEVRQKQLPFSPAQFSALIVELDGVPHRVVDQVSDGDWQLLALVEVAAGDNKTTQSSFIKVA